MNPFPLLLGKPWEGGHGGLVLVCLHGGLSEPPCPLGVEVAALRFGDKGLDATSEAQGPGIQPELGQMPWGSFRSTFMMKMQPSGWGLL